MSERPKAADDFEEIRKRMEELRKEREAAEKEAARADASVSFADPGHSHGINYSIPAGKKPWCDLCSAVDQEDALVRGRCNGMCHGCG